MALESDAAGMSEKETQRPSTIRKAARAAASAVKGGSLRAVKATGKKAARKLKKRASFNSGTSEGDQEGSDDEDVPTVDNTDEEPEDETPLSRLLASQRMKQKLSAPVYAFHKPDIKILTNEKAQMVHESSLVRSRDNLIRHAKSCLERPGVGEGCN
ncbi:uncharacterized protein BXZ73DRAFT_105985 [Epithele typhae]|uniref:uncharacterized protein n=1 Tax=Epithele typhae TaxID=378194 RepID=UPI002007A7DD|nr:uncharacterized protein BXZ73DRAFT_105985 [Epithele typhae]KAH9915918.1 hypothetical protein BXZ73DRAFT_105985 [Epithele typhae]